MAEGGPRPPAAARRVGMDGDGIRSDGVSGATPHVDDRGVTPAVSKSLEMGVVVLFVALLTTVLLGGIVPEYRSAAGATLGERVRTTAAVAVEDAVPPPGTRVRATHDVDLPATLAGEGYEISVDGRWLVLDHPDDDVAGRVRLALPPHVTRVDGGWDSGADAVVRVSGDRGGVVVRLTEADQ